MDTHYRQATAEELAFYTQKLYPLQDQIFALASIYGDKLYLARFYFQHRLSEDLDFSPPPTISS
jgi:hypothetical protein